MEAINSSQLSRGVLDQMSADIGKKLNGDCIFIRCGMQPPLDMEFRITVETIKSRKRKPRDNLVVLVETPGGYIETVERLVSVIRRHYKTVTFVVPDYAYSAGTVLVLSGDRIYMDYYSVLGPIDPQYEDENGSSLLPGAGYLAKFKELTETINKSRSKTGQGYRAELAYLIKRFDPAYLFHIEQAIEHGQSLITEWLQKYKFKDWTKTETKGKKVTPKMREQRATEIAEILGKADHWHSHGRGISMKHLESSEIKLKIDDFGEDEELSRSIRNYHGLCVDYAMTHRMPGFIHTETTGIRRVL